MPRRDWLILAAVLLLAAAFRFVRIDETPPGLWRDEAGYALAAEDVLHGRFQMYWGDKEPLFPYVLAPVFALAGANPVTLRLTAAVFGVATVGVTFLLGRRLFGVVAGMVAAAGLATVFWTVDLNRIGFRVSTMPFVITLAFWFLWRAIDDGRRRDWLVAGVLVGLTPYSYLAARMAPIVALATIALVIRRVSRSNVAIFSAAMLLTFAPLGLFYVANPSYFSDRVSELSPFGGVGGPVQVLAIAGRGAIDTAGMFFVRGDNEPRHNIPGRPVFDPLLALLFVGGIGVVLARFRDPRALFLLIWLVLLLLPSALAVDNPHFLRTLGAAPAALLLVGLGAATFIGAIRWRRLSIGAVAVALALGALLTARDYFVVWAASPLTASFFEAEVAGAARLLAASPNVPSVASAPFTPHPSVEFLTLGRPEPTWIDGGEGIVAVDGPAVYALPASNVAARDLLRTLYPDSAVRANGSQAVAVDIPAGSTPRWLAPPLAADGRFGDLLTILGTGPAVGDVRPGETVTATLYWQVRGPTERPDLAFFVHLLDGSGKQWAQHDGVAYPSDQWRGGERGVSWFPLAVPADAPPGRYQLVAGVYPRGTLQRLPAFDHGAPAGDTLKVGWLVVPLPADMSDPAIRLDRRFGDTIDLRGADVSVCSPAQAPCTLDVTLHWRAAAPIADDLTVFLHLADDSGKPAVTGDGLPVNGTYPTTLWRAGDTIADVHHLAIPAGLPAGRYRVVVGLYRLSDGVRLTTSGGDSATVATYQAGSQP